MNSTTNLITWMNNTAESASASHGINSALMKHCCKELETCMLNISGNLTPVAEFMSAVQYVVKNNAESFTYLKENGLLGLFSMVFSTLAARLTREGPTDTNHGLIELVVETVNVLGDVNLSAKSTVLTEVGPFIVDLLLHKLIGFQTRMEVLKSVNTLLEQCPTAAKESFLNSDDNVNRMYQTADLVKNIGDYEFQVGMVECLMRMFPQKHRLTYASKFIQDQEMLEGFMGIKDKDFETDCRLFLNNVNSRSEDPSKGVFSLPCIAAFVGKKELKKPSDPGYEEFWVDFNIGSERMTLFCEQSSLCSQSSQFDEELWETVAIYRADVQSISQLSEDGMVVLEVCLPSPVCNIYPSQHQDVTDNTIRIHFNALLEDHVSHATEHTFNFSKKKCKASTVEEPLQISVKKVQEVRLEKQSRLNQECPQTCQSSQESVSVKKLKVSVPSVPMVSPLIARQSRLETNIQKINVNNAECIPESQNIDEEVAIAVSKKTCGQKQEPKEFTVPKTPVRKNTHSKAKVKTPVVTVTPPAKKTKPAILDIEEDTLIAVKISIPECHTQGIKETLPPKILEKTITRAKASTADRTLDSGIGLDDSKTSCAELSTLKEATDTDTVKHKQICDNSPNKKNNKKGKSKSKEKDVKKSNFKHNRKNSSQDDEEILQTTIKESQVTDSDINSTTKPEYKRTNAENEKTTDLKHDDKIGENLGLQSFGSVDCDSIPDSYEAQYLEENIRNAKPELILPSIKNANIESNASSSETNEKQRQTKETNNAYTAKKLRKKKSFVDEDKSRKELCELDGKEQSRNCQQKNLKSSSLENTRKINTSDKSLEELYTFNDPDVDIAVVTKGSNKQSSKSKPANKPKSKTSKFQVKLADENALYRCKNVRSRSLRSRKHTQSYAENQNSDEDIISSYSLEQMPLGILPENKTKYYPDTVASGISDDECLLRRNDSKTDSQCEKQEEIRDCTKSANNVFDAKAQSQNDLEVEQHISQEAMDPKPKKGKGKQKANKKNLHKEELSEISENDESDIVNEASSEIRNKKADLKNNERKDKAMPIAHFAPIVNSPVISRSNSSESLVIESDDSYNARRYKLDMELFGRKAASYSSRKRSGKKSHSKGKDKKGDKPQLEDQVMDTDVDITCYKQNEKKRGSKKNEQTSVKNEKQNVKNKSYLLSQSFEEVKNGQSTVKQATFHAITEDSQERKVFQVSYAKSNITCNKRLDAKKFNNKGKAYDPYDFIEQCEHTSTRSERLTRKDESKILNKKLKEKQTQKEAKQIKQQDKNGQSDRNNQNDFNDIENKLALDKATNKWFRKKKTDCKIGKRIKSLQNSPICNGVDVSDIETLRHDQHTEDVYIQDNFQKILQNLSSIKCTFDHESSNDGDTKINASMDIKSPYSVASCCSSPAIGSSKRKYYNPLNVSVVKTPQLPEDTPNIQLESPVKKESKHKRQSRHRNEVEHKYSEDDEMPSTVEKLQKSGRKSRSSTDSVSVLEDSLNVTSRSEKSWIAEKKKKPHERKMMLQTYNCKAKHKHSKTEDSQDELESDDVMVNQRSPVCIPRLPFKLGIGNIFDEKVSLSALPTPVCTQRSRKSGSKCDLDSLLSMPLTGTPFDLNSLYSKNDAEDTQEAITSLDVENFGDECGPLKDNQGVCTKTLAEDGFVSGPSSEVRPTRSSLKRKYPHVTSSDEDDSSASSSEKEVEENSILMPKKLFKFDLAEAPASAPSIFSDVTELPDEDFRTQLGLSAFCAAFGADIQKHLQLKKKRLENFTKQTLKESQKHFNQTWVEQHQNQVNVFDEFQGKMLIELMALEKDIQKLAEAEKKAEDFFKYQLDIIHANKESQHKRIQNMKKLQGHFKERTRAVTKYNFNVHKTLKEKLKEDIAGLQKKLVADTQKEEMMNIRRGLQNLF